VKRQRSSNGQIRGEQNIGVSFGVVWRDIRSHGLRGGDLSPFNGQLPSASGVIMSMPTTISLIVSIVSPFRIND
jgi:hypothetical protein